MGYYCIPRLYHWGHLSLIVCLCLTEGRTSLGAERERKCKERWRRRARESADGRLRAGEWPWSERSPAGWKCTATEDGWGALGHLNIFFSVCVHAPNCFLAYLCAWTEALRVLRGPANPLWGFVWWTEDSSSVHVWKCHHFSFYLRKQWILEFPVWITTVNRFVFQRSKIQI